MPCSIPGGGYPRRHASRCPVWPHPDFPARTARTANRPHIPLPIPMGTSYPTNMAKLYFNYSTMNAGKSTVLLQASHNYRERGMDTYLLTAQFDKRAGDGRIASAHRHRQRGRHVRPRRRPVRQDRSPARAGAGRLRVRRRGAVSGQDQVWQLARAVDDLGVPVMCLRPAGRFPGRTVSRLRGTARPGGRNARGAHHLPLRQEGDDGGAQGQRRWTRRHRRASRCRSAGMRPMYRFAADIGARPWATLIRRVPPATDPTE